MVMVVFEERERESNKVGEGVGVCVLCCSHKDDFVQFTLIKKNFFK